MPCSITNDQRSTHSHWTRLLPCGAHRTVLLLCHDSRLSHVFGRGSTIYYCSGGAEWIKCSDSDWLSKSVPFIIRVCTFPNKLFAQLLPGLETGHRWRSVSHLHINRTKNSPKRRQEKQLSALRKHWNRMQVTDRPSPDAPSLTQAIIVQMVYCFRRIELLNICAENSLQCAVR